MLSSTQEKRWLNVILCLYLALAVGYVAVVPLFEAPDEHHHYFTAQWIAIHKTLPSVPQPIGENGRPFVPQRPADWLGQEAAQPPLYYVLASFVVRPFVHTAAQEAISQAQVQHNPLARLGDGAARVNINGFVRAVSPDEGIAGWVMAAYLLRFVSVLMGLGTLWLVYQSGRVLWPHQPSAAWWATLFVALLPQFAFQFSIISNDALITLLSTAVLYRLLWLVLGEVGETRPWLITGLLIGLAAITKTQGLLLLAFALFFVGAMWLWENRANPFNKQLLGRMGLLLFPALVTAVPLLIRNYTLYGDPTAANQFILIAGGDRGLTLWQSLAEWRAILFSLVGTFGWFNLVPPPWVYWLWFGTATIGAVAGLSYFASARGQNSTLSTQHSALSPQHSALLLLFIWLGLVIAALITFNMQTPAAQGRLLFPALLPITLLVGWGWASMGDTFKRNIDLHWRWSLTLLLFGTGVYCLLGVVQPVYTLPRIIAAEAIPEAATRYETALGQGMTLVAAEIDSPERTHPGEFVDVTLYWRLDAPLGREERPELVIELFGRKNQLLGKVQSWHGRGLFPADFWPVGAIVVENTAVQIENPIGIDEARDIFPTLARVNVKLADGEVAQDVGSTAVEPYSYVDLEEGAQAQVGESIEIFTAILHSRTAVAGDTIELSVRWQVRGDIDQNYTTFVQVGEQGVPPLAQGDSVPRQGNFPTSYWREGQKLRDEYTIALPSDLPAGTYPVYIGLYTPEPPFQRLPLFVDGEARPFNAFLVGEVTVR